MKDAPDKIAILMACYNGDRYLKQQINSIIHQSHQNFELWVSDDGSSDQTLKILSSYQEKLGKHKLKILQGPKCGFIENFMSLIVRDDIKADYYAFSDQDDIWQKEKIKTALIHLKHKASELAGLYTSRTEMIDEFGVPTGKFSPKFKKCPCFANALIQNIAGGNTMIMNHHAREVLKKTWKSQEIINYDWWVYLVLSGIGAVIIYDPKPYILYRQHQHNIIGENMSMHARLKRVCQLFKGVYHDRNTIHIKALYSISSQFTPENQRILDLFSTSRNQSFLPRIFGLFRSGVFCQTFLGHIGLIGAIFLKKI